LGKVLDGCAERSSFRERADAPDSGMLGDASGGTTL
jgi:hypothetical protein